MAEFFAPAFPIAIEATGTPAGICTVDKSESRPFKLEVSIGTPMTGKVGCAAITPAKAAAPPAPAIITFIPFLRASLENFATASGVRCADKTLTSYSSLNSFNKFTASLIVSKSDWLPITIAILALLISVTSTGFVPYFSKGKITLTPFFPFSRPQVNPPGRPYRYLLNSVPARDGRCLFGSGCLQILFYELLYKPYQLPGGYYLPDSPHLILYRRLLLFAICHFLFAI